MYDVLGFFKAADHLKGEAGKDKVGAPLRSLPPGKSTNALSSKSNRSLTEGEGTEVSLCLVGLFKGYQYLLTILVCWVHLARGPGILLSPPATEKTHFSEHMNSTFFSGNIQYFMFFGTLWA